MPVIYCHSCDKHIDLDWDVDHESECNEPEEINDLGGELEIDGVPF